MHQRSVIPAVVLAILFTALPLGAQQTGPDVVSVRSGTFVFDGATQQGTLDLTGTRGFRLEGTVSLAGGNFEAIFQCNTNDACQPGTVVGLDAGWGGLDLHATATLRGRTFGTAAENGGGVIGFSGSVTLPPRTEERTTASAAFEFAGLVQFIEDDGRQIEAVLAGGGNATLDLVWNEAGQPWRIERVTFEF